LLAAARPRSAPAELSKAVPWNRARVRFDAVGRPRCAALGRSGLSPRRRKRPRRRRHGGRSSGVAGHRWSWFWVGVTGGDLDVSQRDAGVESGHDERGSQHVRVHAAEPGTLPDRPNPPMRGAPVEALAVTAPQDRAVVAFPDGQVDHPGGAWNERHGGGLVALAHDPQRTMAALEAEVFDVGDRPR
jgi:hypothetical protein